MNLNLDQITLSTENLYVLNSLAEYLEDSPATATRLYKLVPQEMKALSKVDGIPKSMRCLTLEGVFYYSAASKSDKSAPFVMYLIGLLKDNFEMEKGKAIESVEDRLKRVEEQKRAVAVHRNEIAEEYFVVESEYKSTKEELGICIEDRESLRRAYHKTQEQLVEANDESMNIHSDLRSQVSDLKEEVKLLSEQVEDLVGTKELYDGIMERYMEEEISEELDRVILGET